MCALIPSCVSEDIYTRGSLNTYVYDREICTYTCTCALIPLCVSQDIYTCGSLNTYVCDMGWLRVVGSFKSYVSFAKEPYKRDYILQKRPKNLRSLLIEATP